MRMRAWLRVACATSGLTGCAEVAYDDAMTGDAEVALVDSGSDGDASDWRETVADPARPLPERIDAALRGIDEDRCFRDSSDAAACAWEDTPLVGAQFVERTASDEAIMVIDEITPTVSLLRYRPRVVGFYEVSEDRVLARSPTLRLPATFAAILSGFSHLPAPSADALTPLLEPLKQNYLRSSRPRGSHGETVFNILKELVPNHPLVVVDHANVRPFMRKLLCAAPDRGDGDPDLTEVRAFLRNVASDLSSIIARHGVRYVSASWGDKGDMVARMWRGCRPTTLSERAVAEVLEAWTPIYEVLFATEGVVGVQAADAEGQGELDRKLEWLPNRLRVGAFSYLGTDVPRSGWSSFLGVRIPADEAYADLYVNTGTTDEQESRERGAYGFVHPFGVGRVITLPVVQTSFVTPVALARTVALRRSEPFAERSMSNALIDALSGSLTCRSVSSAPAGCRYLDPLWHDQFDRLVSP